MRPRFIASLALLAALTPAACVTPAATKPTPMSASSGKPQPAKSQDPIGSALTASTQPQARALVVGQVMAPDGFSPGGLIGQDGAGLAGGAVISNDGASIIAGGAGNLRLLAVAEQPLVGAEVFLADAAGDPIPDLPHARTDAQGNYRLTGKVPDGTYTVVVKVSSPKKAAGSLQTLVKTSEAGTTANVGTASTCVTLAVVEGLGGTLGAFNPVTFKSATEATARSLTPANVPDLTDRAAVRSWMQTLSQDVAEIKTLLGAIVQELRDLRTAVDEINEKLDKSPAPTAPPTPAALSGEYDVTFTLQAATPTSDRLVVVIEPDDEDPEWSKQVAVVPGGRATLQLTADEYPAVFNVFVAPSADLTNDETYQGQVTITRYASGIVVAEYEAAGGKPYSLSDFGLIGADDLGADGRF